MITPLQYNSDTDRYLKYLKYLNRSDDPTMNQDDYLDMVWLPNMSFGYGWDIEVELRHMLDGDFFNQRLDLIMWNHDSEADDIYNIIYQMLKQKFNTEIPYFNEHHISSI